MRISAIPVALTLALTLFACEDSGSSADEDAAGGADTAGATGGEGGGAEPAVDCAGRCTTKATACSAPASVAAEACGGLCALGVTEAQAQCLEASGCGTLLSAFTSAEPVCGIEAGAGGGTGTGGGDICGDGTSGYTEEFSNCPRGGDTERGGGIGDACDCGDPTTECEGTENGCKFSLSGGSLECFVNSGEDSDGFCSRTCDPEAPDCPSGSSCNEFELWYDETKTVWRCS